MLVFALIGAGFIFAGGSAGELAVELSGHYKMPSAVVVELTPAPITPANAQRGIFVERALTSLSVESELEDDLKKLSTELADIARLTRHTDATSLESDTIAMPMREMPAYVYELWRTRMGTLEGIGFDLTQIDIDNGLVTVTNRNGKYQCLALLMALPWSKKLEVHEALLQIPLAVEAEGVEEERFLEAIARAAYGQLEVESDRYRIVPDAVAFKRAWRKGVSERAEVEKIEDLRLALLFQAAAIEQIPESVLQDILTVPEKFNRSDLWHSIAPARGSRLEQAVNQRIEYFMSYYAPGTPGRLSNPGTETLWNLLRNEWDRTAGVTVVVTPRLQIMAQLQGKDPRAKIVF